MILKSLFVLFYLILNAKAQITFAPLSSSGIKVTTVIMIYLVFIIVLLSDLFKLVSYLKENHRENKNRISSISVNKNELKENGSVF